MPVKFFRAFAISSMFLLVGSCAVEEGPASEAFDIIIFGGTVYDGLGGPPQQADIAIRDDKIVAIGNLGDAVAGTRVDATGLAVSPGFINMLSWATTSLIHDGRGMSDIKQGVTLEIFGEGSSMGPWTDAEKDYRRSLMGDIKYEIEWTTLGEYLQYMEDRGVAPNLASFIGATTVRTNFIKREDRAATADELAAMQEQVRHAMREGALGVGSSLIYAPASFASTEELTALVAAAAEYDGMYISHMRSEGDQLLEAVDELIGIARATGAPAEIYHLKASQPQNWDKIEAVFERVEAARAEGLAISADMYTYPASSTGFDASMPNWVQEGGLSEWIRRLKDPEIRARVMDEIDNGVDGWTSSIKALGPERILIVGLRNPDLKHLTGKTLAEVAEARGTSAAETAIDLVIEDNSRVQVIYFSMREENMPLKVARPWVSFGSDAGAPAAEGVFLRSSTHPRAYGTFARLLAKYVREDGVITLAEAVRKMTNQPATNLKLRGRGRLAEGYFADIAIFDPATIQDHATFEEPHQYATGMVHVFVNGQQVLRDGEHTGATPGRFVKGPGWTGWEDAAPAAGN